MGLKTAIISSSSSRQQKKSLNPDAKSWFPSAADQNSPSSEITFPHQPNEVSFALPHQIYVTNPPPSQEPVVYQPLLAPTPAHHPPVAVFPAPPHHQCFPSLGYHVPELIYPQQSYCIFPMEKRQVLEEESEGPKVLKRFVPPRFRKAYFEEFRGRKNKKFPPGKAAWKPKNLNDAKIVYPAWKPKNSKDDQIVSPPDQEFCKNTTVMLKNIPNQYRRDSLMAFLDKKCFQLRLDYDFFYLPMDFMRGENLGFAFVNFTTASAVTKIKSALEGYKWGEFCVPKGTFTSKKILEITWAKIQGKEALIRHFQNSNFTCDNIEYLPVVISPPSKGSSVVLKPIGKLQGFSKSTRIPKDIFTKRSAAA